MTYEVLLPIDGYTPGDTVTDADVVRHGGAVRLAEMGRIKPVAAEGDPPAAKSGPSKQK